MCPLVMAWVINCLPSSRLAGLVLSCAGLPTHAITPDNVNVVSLASARLSPSPNDHQPKNRITLPGSVTTDSVRPGLAS